jgi:hypothetical protein
MTCLEWDLSHKTLVHLSARKALRVPNITRAHLRTSCCGEVVPKIGAGVKITARVERVRSENDAAEGHANSCDITLAPVLSLTRNVANGLDAAVPEHSPLLCRTNLYQLGQGEHDHRCKESWDMHVRLRCGAAAQVDAAPDRPAASALTNNVAAVVLHACACEAEVNQFDRDFFIPHKHNKVVQFDIHVLKVGVVDERNAS